MMKKLVLFCFVVLLQTTTMAQTAKPLSEAESQEVIASLTEAAASMRTMQCRFVQQKTMAMLAEPTIAEGTMYYVAPDRLRWEYVTPYSFALVVNGERIVKMTDGKTETLDGKSGKMYQGIVNIIMGSASGKKLFDTSIFDVVLYDDGTYWKAEMTPKRRDMKRMFSQLVFHFDKTAQTIGQVEFIEAGGDVTSIHFEGIRLNEAIGEDKFQ